MTGYDFIEGIQANPRVRAKLQAANLTTRPALEAEIDQLVDDLFPNATNGQKARVKFLWKQMAEMMVQFDHEQPASPVKLP